uniref:Mitochondrial ribosomal protein S21 n=1 Tax=Eptatretus burgeri TaxID=7764 RepID=A0A8C4Q6I9_EPTBU
MALLTLLGDWLEDSGWTNALVQADIASSGTANSFIHASHVTKTRHAQQVNCKLLTQDKFIEDVGRKRYYEKPCRRRQRQSYEMCKRIYDSEMSRWIKFSARKNRTNPWVGY